MYARSRASSTVAPPATMCTTRPPPTTHPPPAAARVAPWNAHAPSSRRSSPRIGPRVLLRDDARRRHRAHAAGVRAGVAIAESLVIARRRQRDHGLAVHERLQAGLFTFEQLLEHDRTAVRRRAAECRARLLRRTAHRDALAEREPVRFHDDRALPAVQRLARRRCIGERLPARRRDTGLAHELFRERLAPFDLRRLP